MKQTKIIQKKTLSKMMTYKGANLFVNQSCMARKKALEVSKRQVKFMQRNTALRKLASMDRARRSQGCMPMIYRD